MLTKAWSLSTAGTITKMKRVVAAKLLVCIGVTILNQEGYSVRALFLHPREMPSSLGYSIKLLQMVINVREMQFLRLSISFESHSFLSKEKNDGEVWGYARCKTGTRRERMADITLSVAACRGGVEMRGPRLFRTVGEGESG